MSTVQMILISGLLGIAACGLIWFGWDLVHNVAISLRAPKPPGAVSDETPPPDSDTPTEQRPL